MATQRTATTLEGYFADNTSGNILASQIRDLTASAFGWTSTSDPTANDDGANTGGHGFFGVGSTWVNTSTCNVWICCSNTNGAAVWAKLSQAVTDVTASSPLASSGGLTPNITLITSPQTTTIGGSISNLTTSPQWYKITVTYTDYSTASNANNKNIFTIQAGTIVTAVKIKHSTAFTGGAISAYNVSIGTTGSTIFFSGTQFDTFGAPSATNYLFGPCAGHTSSANAESHTGTTQVVSRATCSGGLLNAATQGSVDLWLLMSLVV